MLRRFVMGLILSKFESVHNVAVLCYTDNISHNLVFTQTIGEVEAKEKINSSTSWTCICGYNIFRERKYIILPYLDNTVAFTNIPRMFFSKEALETEAGKYWFDMLQKQYLVNNMYDICTETLNPVVVQKILFDVEIPYKNIVDECMQNFKQGKPLISTYPIKIKDKVFFFNYPNCETLIKLKDIFGGRWFIENLYKNWFTIIKKEANYDEKKYVSTSPKFIDQTFNYPTDFFMKCLFPEEDDEFSELTRGLLFHNMYDIILINKNSSDITKMLDEYSD